MIHLAFLLTVLAGGVFFAVARRRFDLFTVAFASAVVYFMPGFWGYVLIPASSGQRVAVLLVSETYTVFIIVLGSIVAGAAAMDRFDVRPPQVRFPSPSAAARTLTLVGLCGAIVSVVSASPEIFSAHKDVVIQSLTRWHVLWVTGASLGAVLSFVARRWLDLGVCTALLLFDLYVGFRSNLALAVIALFVIALGAQEPRRLLFTLQRRWWLASGGAVTLFFGYKFLYRPIKLGDWSRVGELLSDPGFFLRALQGSEPFTTQAILNRVLVERFTAPLSDLTDLVYQLIFFAPDLGARSSMGRPGYRELFPEAVGGIGNNIWAEMWVRGGWVLLALFVVCFVLVLALGSYLLRCPDPLIRAGAALGGAFWAFYIHRNTLAYQITLEKRVFALWILACLAALIWAALLRSASIRRGLLRARGAPVEASVLGGSFSEPSVRS